mmetsp:Transcript_7842/g.10934  ORF Transcript_7842/g.10934 Transcript_7842/m.10934 type:complete len:144 (+) Transcript_7842:70-501(+)
MIRCIIFDFDSTLSSPFYLADRSVWTITDKPEVIETLNDEERIRNFGGRERLAALDSFLQQLSKSNEIFIVSIGFKKAILSLLESVGLAKYFDQKNIFGQECIELQHVDFVKATLITNTIISSSGYLSNQVLFVRIFFITILF